MERRLNVLISAYACEPDKGSEPEVGWQWALQMARFHEVSVLTRANNRTAVESALSSRLGPDRLPRFIYHDLGQLWLFLKRRTPMAKLYYVLWQRSARNLIGQVHQARPFDLMHHVTFAGFRYSAATAGHQAASIWGPVGGIEAIPPALLPWHHPASLAQELLRNANRLHAASPRALRKHARATTLILASTTEMQRAFARAGVESRLMPTIGLNAGQLPPPRERRSPGAVRVLFVGNIITLKGLDLAFEALPQTRADTTLTLLGSGNYLAAARRKVEALGLQRRVIFRGRLPHAEVLQLYREYDLFLFPSLHDTGGYAVIEAMANGLPVVCLDCGGPALAVQQGCGIKVPLGPRAQVISGLAGAIRWYESHPTSLEADGVVAREVVVREYDWDEKGERMNGYYQEAVARFRADPLGREGGTRPGAISRSVVPEG
jgi:glycosyltransferase involved in cell wall biosynthesis